MAGHELVFLETENVTYYSQMAKLTGGATISHAVLFSTFVFFFFLDLVEVETPTSINSSSVAIEKQYCDTVMCDILALCHLALSLGNLWVT